MFAMIFGVSGINTFFEWDGDSWRPRTPRNELSPDFSVYTCCKINTRPFDIKIRKGTHKNDENAADTGSQPVLYD